MSNIHNITNRQLCEYANIFPTVASFLDHLLFTVGTGYDMNEKSGMIVDSGGIPITDYPVLTQDEWDTLMESCHRREFSFAVQFAKRRGEPVDADYLAKCCEVYRVVNVDDSAFTEDALYADLVNLQASRRRSEFRPRPYPLCTKYSDVYNLNNNTPRWFLQIALNFCKAWNRFLTLAIETNDLWTPAPLVIDTELDKISNEIITEIVGDTRSCEYYRQERDYADLGWTTVHRDMIAQLVTKLENMIK